MSDFIRTTDDPNRIESHVKTALETLADWTRKMQNERIDAAAVYTALKTMQIYYYEMGRNTLGPSYAFKMDKEAGRLAQKMLVRDL